MARIVSASAEPSGPAGAGSILPWSGAKRAMRSAGSSGRQLRRVIEVSPSLPALSRAGLVDARSPAPLPATGGLAYRNNALLTTPADPIKKLNNAIRACHGILI